MNPFSSKSSEIFLFYSFFILISTFSNLISSSSSNIHWIQEHVNSTEQLDVFWSQYSRTNDPRSSFGPDSCCLLQLKEITFEDDLLNDEKVLKSSGIDFDGTPLIPAAVKFEFPSSDQSIVLIGKRRISRNSRISVSWRGKELYFDSGIVLINPFGCSIEWLPVDYTNNTNNNPMKRSSKKNELVSIGSNYFGRVLQSELKRDSISVSSLNLGRIEFSNDSLITSFDGSEFSSFLQFEVLSIDCFKSTFNGLKAELIELQFPEFNQEQVLKKYSTEEIFYKESTLINLTPTEITETLNVPEVKEVKVSLNLSQRWKFTKVSSFKESSVIPIKIPFLEEFPQINSYIQETLISSLGNHDDDDNSLVISYSSRKESSSLRSIKILPKFNLSVKGINEGIKRARIRILLAFNISQADDNSFLNQRLKIRTIIEWMRRVGYLDALGTISNLNDSNFGQIFARIEGFLRISINSIQSKMIIESNPIKDEEEEEENGNKAVTDQSTPSWIQMNSTEESSFETTTIN